MDKEKIDALKQIVLDIMKKSEFKSIKVEINATRDGKDPKVNVSYYDV